MATQLTTSMISETMICNMALAWLGQNQITSLDDPADPLAEVCRNTYPFVRDAVLEERMWTFGTNRATSTSEERDEWDQLYRHSIPLDWLSVYRVYGNPVTQDNINWVKEDKYVLADKPTIYMWGLKRIVDTGQFSNLFVQALAARMAADLAIALTQDRLMQADMWSLYQTKLREAAARDGAQGRNDQFKAGSLVTQRRGGSGGLR